MRFDAMHRRFAAPAEAFVANRSLRAAALPRVAPLSSTQGAIVNHIPQLPWPQQASLATLVLAWVSTAILLAACTVDEGPAEKYAGTWVSACEATDLYAVDQPNQPLKSTYQLKLTRTDDQTLRFAAEYRVYPAAGCNGAPLATHSNNSADNTYVLDGTQRIEGSEADRITVNMAALGTAANAGEPVVVDGIRYAADFFIGSVRDNKDLIVLDGGGLRFGAGDVVDADGYPTALDPAPRLMRRPD